MAIAAHCSAPISAQAALAGGDLVAARRRCADDAVATDERAVYLSCRR